MVSKTKNLNQKQEELSERGSQLAEAIFGNDNLQISFLNLSEINASALNVDGGEESK